MKEEEAAGLQLLVRLHGHVGRQQGKEAVGLSRAWRLKGEAAEDDGADRQRGVIEVRCGPAEDWP
eukprot:9493974-Pyramimonas_sp.AAC.1